MSNFKPCAMTMVYRDATHLKIWVDHYGREFGKENLFVLAHGLTPEIAQIAQGCQIIPLPRGRVSENFNQRRWALMTAWANFSLETYDCVVGGDVDEYVFADPKIAPNLKSFLEANQGQNGALNCYAFEMYHDRTDQPLDRSKPILAQRRHAVTNTSYCKPLVVYQPINWLPGGHASNFDPYLPDGLYMAHLRFADKELFSEVAKVKAEIMEKNGGADAYRKSFHTFWLRGAAYGNRFCRLASNRPQVDFDDLSEELVQTLRANVIPHKRNKRLKHFGEYETEYPSLTLPERFGNILAPNGLE